MEKSVLFVILILSFVILRGQNTEIIKEKLLTYQRIVICEGKSKEMLYKILKNALYGIYDSALVKIKNESQMVVKSNFEIQNRLIGKIGNPAGVLAYRLTIEIKDEKYRYNADEFYFTPFKRDRYGRFSSSGERPVRVSEENFSSDKALLGKIEEQSQSYIKRLDRALLDYLVVPEKQTLEW